MMKKIIAVYCIENIYTNEKYIGSSNHFKRRESLHKHDLKFNKHHSYKLQESYNKFGNDKFKIVILEILDNDDKLKQREQFYIDKLMPVFNISKYSDSTLGTKRTDETKAKIGEKSKGRYQPSGINSTSSIQIEQYDLKGNYINTFGSVKEIERAGFGTTSHICAVCKGKNKQHKGYIYKYKN